MNVETIPEKRLLEKDNQYRMKKRKFLIWFGFVAGIILLFFSIYNFVFLSDYWAFGLELFLSLLLFYALFELINKSNLNLALNAGVVVAAIMTWQNYYSGGLDGTGIYWVFTLPIIIYFLIGSQNAAKVNLILYIGILFLFIASKFEDHIYDYDNLTFFVMALVISLITFVTHLYQTGLEQYISEVVVDRERIGELSRLRQNFIDIVSHQLKTPLGTTRWYFEVLLENQEISEDLKNLLENIYKSTVTTIDRVDEMLLAIDIYEGRTTLNKTPVNIWRLTHDEIDKHKRLSSPREVQFFANNISKDQTFILDQKKIKLIFHTLIDNAFKYTKENGQIIISLEVKGRDLIFAVKDNGIGIPKSTQDTIFDIFVRGENAVLANPNASGVGLYISNYFTKQHDGNITFTSKEGEGTTFIVTIPVYKKSYLKP